MKWNPSTRRHFLEGAGKAALMLPFLPSLLPEKAARAQTTARQKTFIGIAMEHGIADMNSSTTGGPSIYMPVLKNMQAFQPPGVHAIAWKTLDAARNDAGGKVSDVFDAAFNPYLSKMLMLQGLDYYPSLWTHHGGQFGNLAELHVGMPYNLPKQASIDQVMAYSPSFYRNPALLGTAEAWTGNQTEWNYANAFTFSNPSNKVSSAIENVGATFNPQALWDAYFKNFVGGGALPPPPVPAGPTMRQKLADQVLLDYRAVLKSPRLGKEDRLRIERQVELLTDTQKSLAALTPMPFTPVSCKTAPPRPAMSGATGYAARKQLLQAMNNVIVSLVACGLCHSFTSHFNSLVSDDPEQWHAWAHAGAPEHKQQTSAVLHDVVLDLVAKLDQNGLLDDTLVIVPQEHNKKSHQTWDTGVVTFGSAGGVLKTGQFIDFGRTGSGTNGTRWGFPMTQFFANALMAMDVPASEFEALNKESQAFFSPGKSGYGNNRFSPADIINVAAEIPQFKGRNLSEWLPLVKA